MSAKHLLHFSGWPTCIDGMSWSADCEIAIALSESVEVLHPRLKFDAITRAADGAEENKWHRTRFQANLFTKREVPLFDPLPFGVSSIGEEQSLSTVSGLSWSPSGLVKYKKCALGVLTTNHVLSIWTREAGSDVSAIGSWNRSLVINEALRHGLNAQPNYLDGSQEPNLTWLRSRVRGFCWAPSVQDADVEENMLSESQSFVCHNFLAATNDCNEIIILRIESPHRNPRTEWKASIVACARPRAGAASSEAGGLPFMNLNNQVSSVFRISWSPWVIKRQAGGKTLTSRIACVPSSKLSLIECNLDLMTDQLRLNVLDDDIVVPGVHSGPLKWTYQRNTESAHLFSFTKDHVYCIKMPLGASNATLEDLSISTYRRNPFSDQISGVVFKDRGTSNSMDFSSHLSIEADTTMSLDWPFEPHTSRTSPSWLKLVKEYQNSFDVEHELGGNITTRIWGIASNPTNDCVAVAFSVHPAEMIQYATSTEQDLILVFDVDTQDFSRYSRFNSVESIFFSILRHLTIPLESSQHANQVGSLVHALRHVSNTSANHPHNRYSESSSLSDEGAAAAFIKHSINSHKSFADLVLEHLKASRNSPAPDASESPPVRTEVIWKLCASSLSIPQHLYVPTVLGSQILQNYQFAQRLLVQTWPSFFADFDTRFSQNNISDPVTENCEICTSPIGFEHPSWARCELGHEFERCGLTFLAIQSPGISKYCGVCNQCYLTEQALVDLENAKTGRIVSDAKATMAPITNGNLENGDGEDEPAAGVPASLTRILTVACDVCIYCGAKFQNSRER